MPSRYEWLRAGHVKHGRGDLRGRVYFRTCRYLSLKIIGGFLRAFWFGAVGHSLDLCKRAFSLPEAANGRFSTAISSTRVSQNGRTETVARAGCGQRSLRDPNQSVVNDRHRAM